MAPVCLFMNWDFATIERELINLFGGKSFGFGRKTKRYI